MVSTTSSEDITRDLTKDWVTRKATILALGKVTVEEDFLITINDTIGTMLTDISSSSHHLREPRQPPTLTPLPYRLQQPQVLQTCRHKVADNTIVLPVLHNPIVTGLASTNKETSNPLAGLPLRTGQCQKAVKLPITGNRTILTVTQRRRAMDTTPIITIPMCREKHPKPT